MKSIENYLPLLGLIFLTGCASKDTLYSWGSYEGLIYESYAKPGSVPPEKQIEKLEADLQVARSQNKSVPPGFHAHLGYIYYQVGKADLAVKHFQIEKKIYPSSAKLMGRLMGRLSKS